MASKKGIHPLHFGVTLADNIIAPPTQFALATIGVMDYYEIKEVLEELVLAGKEGILDSEETPMVLEYVNEDLLNVNYLKFLARKTFGSQKIITNKAVLPINDNNQIASISINHIASLKIESRELRTKKKPSGVVIYNPFEIDKIFFKGGTEFSYFISTKGNHWAKGQPNEGKYLKSLSTEQRAQFEEQIDIVDYNRACSLIELSRTLNMNKGLEHKITGGAKEYGEVVLPFNFLPKQNSDLERRIKGVKYAVEALLLRVSPKKMIKETLGHKNGKLNLADIDRRLFGHQGFGTEQIQDAYKNRSVTVGAIIYSKNFGNYTWAVIQAIENYYFSEGREFKGYSIEFQDDPNFTTTSIVFDHKHKDVSMRIIFDDNFGLPYLLYKDFEQKTNKVKFINDKPTKLINLPEEKSPWKKGWISYDWRTGRPCLSVIREPNYRILKDAERISKQVSSYGINALTMKNRYFRRMQELK